MSAPVNEAQCFVELTRLTSWNEQRWSDFLACTREEQTQILQNYKDAIWIQNRDTFADLLNVLTILGTVASAVSGVAGAASAIAALKAL
jgi:hypothetical protein